MLSTRAIAWLDTLGVTQRRSRLDEAALRRWLADHSLPAWPALLAIEASFGGLANAPDADRQLSFGIGDARTIDKRPHVAVGGYSPISWYMDEAGRVVEVDDLGELFYASDSLAHRIEQLAVVDQFPAHVSSLDGFHGTSLATALDLARIEEACDSRQRIWMSDTVMVRESLEPPEYGARDLVEKTWVSAYSPQSLQRVLAAKK